MKAKLMALLSTKDELKKEAMAITDTAIVEGRIITDDEEARVSDITKEVEKLESQIKNITKLMDDAPVAEAVKDTAPTVEAKKGFTSFGEQLLAVKNASMGRVDSRLFNAAGASEGGNSGADGGYLVQTDFVNDIMSGIYGSSVLAPLCTKISISSNANSIAYNTVTETSRADGYRFGGLQASWIGEGAQISSSKPTFKRTTLSLEKLCALFYATDELLQDSSALATFVSQAVQAELAFKLDDAILNGDGSAKPDGILNSTNAVTISKESNQTTVLELANLLKMLAACDDRNGKAEWFMNKEMIPALYALAANNQNIFMPGNSIAGVPYNTLFGKKINFIEQAAAPKTKGDIMLADMSQYLLADKGGIKADSSMSVRFDYDETAFRFIYRVNGAPLVTSGKAPYKGSQNTSPFVVLQARS